MEKGDDAYKILGIDRSASDEQIKNAFRKLALKHHPDRHKDKDAKINEDIFKKINDAYNILNDPEKKRVYDQFGLEGLQGGPRMQDMGEMGDIFNMFGGMNMGGRTSATERPLEINHMISLEDIFTKSETQLKYGRHVKCTTCAGTGNKEKKKTVCVTCKGHGVTMTQTQMGHQIFMQQTVCPSCRGSKKAPVKKENICNNCDDGKIMEEHVFKFKIPSNIHRTSKVQFDGKGNYNPVTDKYASLIIKCGIILPKGYGIDQASGKLCYMMSISLAESIYGFRRVLDHPSGKKILIQSEKGHVVNSNMIYFLEAEGMYSDILILEFTIDYPDYLSNIDNDDMTILERLGNTNTKLTDAQCNVATVRYTLHKLDKTLSHHRQGNQEEEFEEQSGPQCTQQ